MFESAQERLPAQADVLALQAGGRRPQPDRLREDQSVDAGQVSPAPVIALYSATTPEDHLYVAEAPEPRRGRLLVRVPKVRHCGLCSVFLPYASAGSPPTLTTACELPVSQQVV